jgi:hypothetical protein
MRRTAEHTGDSIPNTVWRKRLAATALVGTVGLLAACSPSGDHESSSKSPASPAASSETPGGTVDVPNSPPTGGDTAAEARQRKADDLMERATGEICHTTFQKLYEKEAAATTYEYDGGESGSRHFLVTANIGKVGVVRADYGYYEKRKQLTEDDCSGGGVYVFKSGDQRSKFMFGFSDVPNSSAEFLKYQSGPPSVTNDLHDPTLGKIHGEIVSTTDDGFSEQDLKNYQLAGEFVHKNLS